MKVVLVNPPDTYLKHTGDRPPLGLAYIAAYAQNKGFSDIKIVDMNHDSEIPEADVFGFGAATPSYNEAVRIAGKLKSRDPNCTTVIGGAHASAVPETATAFDKVVVGEGEDSFVKILENGCPERIVSFPLIRNLDDIPMPAWGLLPMKKYSLDFEGKPATSLITSRGCPFACCYCGKQIFGRTWRGHSAQRVVQEMQYLNSEFGYENFFIYDDAFTLKKDRIFEMQKMFREERMEWVDFRCTTRADLVDSSVLRALKEMGCTEVCFGVESGNDEILRLNNKGMTTQQNMKAVNEAKRLGLKVKAYFIIGMPFETRETVLQTLEFAKKLDPHDADFYVMAPFPGSPMWENPEKYGVTIEKNCDWNYLQASRGAPEPKVYSKQLGKEQRMELYYLIKEEWKRHCESRSRDPKAL